MISKSAIVQQVLVQLGAQLDTLANAARTMHADASDEQNIAEDKYDTRGLETAYLASSHARLATETEQALATYQALKLQEFSKESPIDVTALVELDSKGKRSFYFLGPCSGGLEIQHKGQEILVITPQSPLGQLLCGKHAGERVKLQTTGPAQEFRVVSVV